MQPDEVQSRHIGHDTLLMYWFVPTIVAMDRQVNPRESVLVAGAPDHVSDPERAAVCQQRQSGLHTYGSRDALDSGLNQVLRFDTDQRSSLPKQSGPQFSPDGCVH